MRTFAAILATAVTLVGPPVQEEASVASEVRDREAYAVYASLLPAEWTVKVARARTLVIQRETATKWDCMPTGKPLETDWRPVLDGFKEANRTVQALLPGQSLSVPYVVVSSAEIRLAFREPGSEPWTAFYRRYPESGGYMLFSAVGFDSEKRRAMVYVGHWCGSSCGGGMHHFLEKADGRWHEVTIPGVVQRIWVS